MSWLSDILDFGGSVVGYDTVGSDLGDYFNNFLGAPNDPKDPKRKGGDSWNLDLVNGILGGALGLGQGYFQQGINTDILEQGSAQWEAEFDYKKQIDEQNLALAQQKMALSRELANIQAGAATKAANIAAAAQNKRTLNDAYGQYLQALGGQRRDELEAHNLLQQGAVSPLMQRMKSLYTR